MERTNYKTPRNEHGLPNIVIPAEVLFHEKLTPNERILFGIINNLAYNQNGYCWASNRFLTRMLQIKQQTSVSAMLSKLQKECFIKMEYETRYDGKQVRKIFVDKTYPIRYSDSLQQAFKNLQKPIINKIRPIRVDHKGGYGNPKGGLGKNINNIDIDIDRYDNTKVLSDDPPGPLAPSVHPEVESILSFWFNLPNTIQHKASSKIYERSVQVIENLLKGLPIQSTKDGQPYKDLKAFCTKHKIDPELLSRKWPKNTIKGILRSIHKHLSDEGGPDKISLDSIFWNRFAKNGGWSWFLFKAAEKTIPDEFVEMASKLSQAIQISLTEAKKMNWARDFQELCQIKPNQEVNEVLDWYMSNYDYLYVKSVQSAKQFSQFYPNIRKSMLNQENDNKPTPPKGSNLHRGTGGFKVNAKTERIEL
jgi:hypothetical protein